MINSDEIKLLLCSVGCDAETEAGAGQDGNGIANDVDAAPALLTQAAAADTSAEVYYTELRLRISDLLQQGTRKATAEVLKAGIYCLEGVVQRSLCGPIQLEHAPLWQSAYGSSSGSSRQQEGIGSKVLFPDERWVISQLQVDGEELVANVQGLDLLLAALLLLAEPCGMYTTAARQQQQQQHLPVAPASVGASSNSESQQQQQQQQVPDSRCWWALRAVMLQQHVLRGKSNTIQTATRQLMQQTLAWVDALQDQSSTADSSNSSSSSTVSYRLLAAAARLECAAVHQHFGQAQVAQQQLEAAAAVLGVTVEVTGALGYRTKHQLDAKPQLVAAVTGPAAAAGVDHGAAARDASDVTAAAAVMDVGVDLRSLGFDQLGSTKELEGMHDDSAVYLAPRLTAAAAAGNSPQQQQQQQQQQQLPCIQQALLLAWASQVHKETSKDDLQQWQMAPFVEAVLQQQQTQYMLHATACLLKCRHERERGRTRERSLMQLEQLCNALEATQPPVASRLPYVYAVRFPLWPQLRKELAELYIAMGFVGAALKIFESLEMWDQLILCYRLLDKKQLAQDLVQQRLQACPDDAKVWCVLGDIQQQDQHYIKAWEVSYHRSSRAQRSLARSALQRKEYQQAAMAYDSALGLNPLYPDAWFNLGYCYLKLREIRRALQAFTKVTQLESDHGEAWTNLAALWLQEGGWKEALQASEQAVKYKRDSWQTWDNYAAAAVKAGNNMAAVRALGQVFELTRGEHFALATAEQLMTQIEQEAVKNTAQPNSSISYKQPAAATAWEDEGEAMEAPDQLLSLLAMSDRLPNNSSSTTSDAAAASSAASTAAAAARLRMYDQVMTLFGQLLKSVTNSPACSPAIWGLYARWYQLQGHLLSSQEAYLKQVRALQSTPFKSDPEHFSTMTKASINLCRAYMASAYAGQGGLRDLSAARIHLRGVLKQCEDSFEGTEQYLQMQALLQEVLAAEDSARSLKRASIAVA